MNRIPDELLTMSQRITPQPPAGFMVIAVASTEQGNASPLQSLYQQMYEQAVQATRRPQQLRDLFAIMN